MIRRICLFILSLLLFAVIAGRGVARDHELSAYETKTIQSRRELTRAETELIEGSRNAILRTGISESYFDKHFEMYAVHESPADRRVVWIFRIGEYETTVQDAIGSYVQGTERKYSHSINSVLPSMTEIRRVISRKRAETVLRACLGKFSTTAVELGPVDNTGRAGLFLTASALTILTSKNAPNRKKSDARSVAADSDLVKEEARRRTPVILGAVNLQTGKCKKGKGWAGPSVATPE